jgi:hypothetical protein
MKQNNLLYICFNRLDLVQNTLPDLLALGWDNVVVACDGARSDEEKKVVELIRTEIDEIAHVNAQQIEKVYRDHNYGCRRNIEHALEYFFHEYGQGWVFEDDIKLDNLKDFLKLRDEWRAEGHLSLYNPLKVNQDSIFTTQIGHYFIWGWYLNTADMQLSFRSELSSESFFKSIKYRGFGKGIRFFWLYLRTLINKIDTWDSLYTSWAMDNNVKLHVVPVSLIKNLGFDDRATHTFDSPIEHPQSNVGVKNPKVWENKLKKWL